MTACPRTMAGLTKNLHNILIKNNLLCQKIFE